MAKSNKSVPSSKTTPGRLSAVTTARKPYAGFPLTPHPSGRWCKKIRGKLHYIGKLASPDAALEPFNREWPYLKGAGTPPPIDTGDGCTVRQGCRRHGARVVVAASLTTPPNQKIRLSLEAPHPRLPCDCKE